MSVSCDTCKNGNGVCPHICLAGSDYEPMTNADRIRNFSDEELAKFLVRVNCEYAKDCMVGIADCKHAETDKDCEDCFLEWLQADKKEGADDGDTEQK